MQINQILEQFIQYEGNYYRRQRDISEKEPKLLLEEEVSLPIGGLKKEYSLPERLSEKILSEKLGEKGISAAELPSSLDYSKSPYLPPVAKQNENSCVGFSVGYYLRTYQEARENSVSVGSDPTKIFSPSFIYNQINGGVDEGSTLMDAGDLLQNVGAATLRDFPYYPNDYVTLPNQATRRSAYPHRIKQWRILYTSLDDPQYMIEKTKEYLNTGDLPVVGINVGFKWKYPYQDEQGHSIITSEEYAVEGHAVVVVGYDDKLPTPDGKGAFKIINSYGKEWRMGGYAYISYERFTKALRTGFVFVDMPTYPMEELSLVTERGVLLNIVFNEQGSYDLSISDDQNHLIHHSIDHSAKPGENTYYWNGKDLEGKDAPPGVYFLSIHSQGKEIFRQKFEKSSLLSDIAAIKTEDEMGKRKIRMDIKVNRTVGLIASYMGKTLFNEDHLSSDHFHFFEWVLPDSTTDVLHILVE